MTSREAKKLTKAMLVRNAAGKRWAVAAWWYCSLCELLQRSGGGEGWAMSGHGSNVRKGKRMNRKLFHVGSIVCLVVAVVLSTALVAQAQQRKAVQPEAITPQTHLVSCTLCFTCGGNWPSFQGEHDCGNSGCLPRERGSACSGSVTTIRSDRFPQLCCNASQ
jgi:hypothetical protein